MSGSFKTLTLCRFLGVVCVFLNHVSSESTVWECQQNLEFLTSKVSQVAVDQSCSLVLKFILISVPPPIGDTPTTPYHFSVPKLMTTSLTMMRLSRPGLLVEQAQTTNIIFTTATDKHACVCICTHKQLWKKIETTIYIF